MSFDRISNEGDEAVRPYTSYILHCKTLKNSRGCVLHSVAHYAERHVKRVGHVRLLSEPLRLQSHMLCCQRVTTHVPCGLTICARYSSHNAVNCALCKAQTACSGEHEHPHSFILLLKYPAAAELALRGQHGRKKKYARDVPTLFITIGVQALEGMDRKCLCASMAAE